MSLAVPAARRCLPDLGNMLQLSISKGSSQLQSHTTQAGFQDAAKSTDPSLGDVISVCSVLRRTVAGSGVRTVAGPGVQQLLW